METLLTLNLIGTRIVEKTQYIHIMKIQMEDIFIHGFWIGPIGVQVSEAKSFDHEITQYIVPSDSLEIDVDFQSYTWSGSQTPSYIVECQLFQYQASNFNNSVEITDIIKPSKKDEYSRFNPICGKPLIEIRNYGSSTLNNVEIIYGIKGGSIHTFNWSGV